MQKEGISFETLENSLRTCLCSSVLTTIKLEMQSSKVDVKNSEDTSGITGALALTANGRGEPTLPPVLRQILIGICIGMGILLIIITATLGALLNTNIKEISSLKQSAESMQMTINVIQSQINVIKSPSKSLDNVTMGGVIDTTTKQDSTTTEHVTESGAMSNNLTPQQGDATTQTSATQDYNTILEIYNARIAHLEADHLKMNDSILILDDKVARLEIARAQSQNQMSNMNDTVRQLRQDATTSEDRLTMTYMKIAQLELERAIDRDTIKHLNESQIELESDLHGMLQRTDSESLNMSNYAYNLNNTCNCINSTILQSLYANISKLEKDQATDRALTEMLNSSITQLGSDFNMQYQTMADQIQKDVETNKASVQNISDLLSALHTERLDDTSALDAYSEKLSDIGLVINVTNDMLLDLDARVSYIEDGLNCTWGNWTVFTNCSSNGIQYRERVCESPNLNVTDLWYSRKDTEIRPCYPVNGGWGEWRASSACSASCGGGTMTRVRACDSPAPANGGEPCPGEATDTQTCNTIQCVPGDCSEIEEILGNGVYTIYLGRRPDHGISVYCEFGDINTGYDGTWTVIQQQVSAWESFDRGWADYKNGFGTPAFDVNFWLVNGGWGEWRASSACSASCGGGTMTRVRDCDGPVPANGGEPCPGEATDTQTCNTIQCVPGDCSEIEEIIGNGVYTIYLGRRPDRGIRVYCEFGDFNTGYDGTWTVIQQQVSSWESFNRGWADYKNGFGTLEFGVNFWLGNDYIHQITSSGNYKLKVRLKDSDTYDSVKYAYYSTFSVANEDDKYRLTVGGFYSGGAGDSLTDNHNGMPFSTFDADNSGIGCPTTYSGAWWYGSTGTCGDSCLNGKYYNKYENLLRVDGIKWNSWRMSHSFINSAMMIQKN